VIADNRRVSGQTLSAVDDGDARLDRECPHLYFVACAHNPLARPFRLALAGVTEVTFGRGPEPSVVADPAARSVAVALNDPWTSSAHARLVRGADGWEIVDAGSKNGTIVPAG
jgi:hypothetical protein